MFPSVAFFLMVGCAIFFGMYIANTSKDAEYKHICKVISKHNLQNFYRLNYKEYSIVYNSNFNIKKELMHITAYLYKNKKQLGIITYVTDMGSKSKICYDEIASDDLKMFVKLIDENDMDSEWV